MSTQFRTQFGKKMRKSRKQIGISQKELARYLQISDKTISAYETGRAEPGIEMASKIARSLHRPLDYFDEEATPIDLKKRLKMSNIDQELLELEIAVDEGNEHRK